MSRYTDNFSNDCVKQEQNKENLINEITKLLKLNQLLLTNKQYRNEFWSTTRGKTKI